MSTYAIPKPLNMDFYWKKLPISSSVYIIEPKSNSAASTSKKLEQIKAENLEKLSSPLSAAQKWERELEDIVRECSVPDWDGYDAKPLDEGSVQCVRAFCQKLPSAITLPNLLPEPNGDLTMEWYKNGYHLVIGIDKQKQIAWACRTDNERYGGDGSFADSIPDSLLSLLHRIEKGSSVD
jgi:hypothetical protein